MAEELDRHSKAFEAELIKDVDQLAAAEARNGLRQFDAVVELTDYFLQSDHPFKLRPSHLLHLHRTALEGISAFAGNYRPAAIEIGGSKHKPVGAHLVPGLICIRLGYQLPGTNTIPEQISTDKAPYYHALEAADAAYRPDHIDLGQLEELLGGLLANQLISIHKKATGTAAEPLSRRFH